MSNFPDRDWPRNVYAEPGAGSNPALWIIVAVVAALVLGLFWYSFSGQTGPAPNNSGAAQQTSAPAAPASTPAPPATAPAR
jgi:hypothetical protein